MQFSAPELGESEGAQVGAEVCFASRPLQPFQEESFIVAESLKRQCCRQQDRGVGLVNNGDDLVTRIGNNGAGSATRSPPPGAIGGGQR